MCGTCGRDKEAFIHQRAGSPLPSSCDIYHPLFLSETATRSRVATPDTAIAASLVSTLGGGACSIRGKNKDVSIVKDREDEGTPLVLSTCLGVWQTSFFVP